MPPVGFNGSTCSNGLNGLNGLNPSWLPGWLPGAWVSLFPRAPKSESGKGGEPDVWPVPGDAGRQNRPQRPIRGAGRRGALFPRSRSGFRAGALHNCDPEPKIGTPDVGGPAKPCGGAAECSFQTPGTAPGNPKVSRAWPGGVRTAREFRRVPSGTPFRDIPVHIEEPPCVRGIAAGRAGSFQPGIKVGLIRLEFGA